MLEIKPVTISKKPVKNSFVWNVSILTEYLSVNYTIRTKKDAIRIQDIILDDTIMIADKKRLIQGIIKGNDKKITVMRKVIGIQRSKNGKKNLANSRSRKKKKQKT